MPVKMTRKALKVAGLKSYFGSARKAYTYRAARRNATIHRSYFKRKAARPRATTSAAAEPKPQRKAWWQFWK